MKKTFIASIYLLFTLFQVKNSNGQIVYTDIPDLELICNQSCQNSVYLDLNTDGISDCFFEVITGSYIGVNNKNFYDNLLRVSCLNGASIVREPGIVAPFFYYPAALKQNSPIESSELWGGGGLLKRKYYICCQYGPCPNKKCNDVIAGNWLNSSEHFLGLRLIINGQNHYGWIRLTVSVSKNEASAKIKDYAYESTPDAGIIAGETGASVTKSSNENQEIEITKPGDLKISPNPVVSSTNISFTLSKSGKVSLTVYDVTGRIVKTIADKEMNEGEHQVTLDVKDMNAGIYLLRLQTAEFVRSKKIGVVK